MTKEQEIKEIYRNITIQKENPVFIPDDILKNYLTGRQIAICNSSPTVSSITVYADK